MHIHLLAHGKLFKIITDIGLRINDNRKEFQEQIRGMTNRNILHAKNVCCENCQFCGLNPLSKWDCEHIILKDKITRFGFGLMKYVAKLYCCDFEITDTTEKAEQKELEKDFIQMVTAFICRFEGKYVSKARRILRESRKKIKIKK